MTLSSDVIKTLKDGGIGVIPTDTIYGLVGRAENPDTVERIYKVRKRNPEKPCIILISSFDDLKKFDIEISPEIKKFLEAKKLWPGKVSVILPASDEKFKFLTRGTRSLAFRMPDVEELKDLIKEAGPIIAPSSNPEGLPHAKNIAEAKTYFENDVNFYVDGGELSGAASTVIKFENEKPAVLREGAVKINVE